MFSAFGLKACLALAPVIGMSLERIIFDVKFSGAMVFYDC